MTQEDKEILLKDLCMRLPYNVWVSYKTKYDDIERATILNGNYVRDIMEGTSSWIDVKPYLRPMSSMTEEEMVDCAGFNFKYKLMELEQAVGFIDWLLKHHFDFMGLIPIGAAIEITENNNPYKD